MLRTETIGGAILLGAAVLALLWANSPWFGSYDALRQIQVGPEWGHLRLTLAQWASDGLLAVFFFVVGLELKREFLVGDLRAPSKAAIPIIAAAAGVAVPALMYTGIVTGLGADADARHGWAIPTATDIAFALAVLAVIGSHLPSGLRTFLLTLAVVDDLIAITIIAIFYTSDLQPSALLAALVPLGLFAGLLRARITHWFLLVPLALVTWGLVHASGVHATVAGVLLGFTVPVLAGRTNRLSTTGAEVDIAHSFERTIRPLSAGVAIPIFAFFASGVRVVGGGLRETFADEVAIAITASLVLGKLVGVFGATWLTVRFTKARLADGLAWPDIAGLALLTGIGFTVSLLVGELSFGEGSERDDHVRVAIITGSLIAATLGGGMLRHRNSVHRRRPVVAGREHPDGG